MMSYIGTFICYTSSEYSQDYLSINDIFQRALSEVESLPWFLLYIFVLCSTLETGFSENVLSLVVLYG